MKFVSREPTKREADEGAVRVVVKFAWRPINCDDGHTYWLRRIVIEQRARWWRKWWKRGIGGYGPKSPRWQIISKLPLYKLPKAQVRLLKGDGE